ncbi:hypothetical protein [Paractinoplanes rishiriensis]|uniref:Uncharacterized protein n=1 Tax=Paractinoplanes rishiriensis TaxID=1050105 RepID=A0A919K6R8_9ACTN|nr:hypothetical protein [Actinoplanes rishiriensis]GIE99807.1 hypothetical protein Ari01nite_72720 [Actinoplanes rishiriensis]
MTTNEAATLLVSAVTSAYLATQSAAVAGTVAAAVILLKITDDQDESFIHRCARHMPAGAEEKRS